MKILNENLTDLEKEILEEGLESEEISKVKTTDEGYALIEEHFGTLKCKSDDYLTDEGELWIVHPPRGIYGGTLNILIKKMEYKVQDLFSNGTSNELDTFGNKKEAEKYYKKQLQKDGEVSTDLLNWSIEILKIDSDGDIETIESQDMFKTGLIDRGGSDVAINYYYEAVWDAKKQELLYTFYLNGEKEDKTVYESDLKNWYFNNHKKTKTVDKLTKANKEKSLKTKIQNRLDNESGLDTLLADRARVDDYYTEEYNDAVDGGMDFDLMFDIDKDHFFAVDLGMGKIYEQQNNCLFISREVSTSTEEELGESIENYIENLEK